MLDIKDRPGCITKAEMRGLFERAVRETAAFAANTPLNAMTINGEFSHYLTPDTDTLWIGFAIGMRTAERLARAHGIATKAAPKGQQP